VKVRLPAQIILFGLPISSEDHSAPVEDGTPPITSAPFYKAVLAEKKLCAKAKPP
jgi:hypothetical protein